VKEVLPWVLTSNPASSLPAYRTRVRAQVRVRSLGRNGLRRYCLRLWSRYADTASASSTEYFDAVWFFFLVRKRTERNSTGTCIIFALAYVSGYS
jgi:hypothetical protein